jgi:hypothetical protein
MRYCRWKLNSLSSSVFSQSIAIQWFAVVWYHPGHTFENNYVQRPVLQRSAIATDVCCVKQSLLIHVFWVLCCYLCICGAETNTEGCTTIHCIEEWAENKNPLSKFEISTFEKVSPYGCHLSAVKLLFTCVRPNLSYFRTWFSRKKLQIL